MTKEKPMPTTKAAIVLSSAVFLATILDARPAAACGCFASPSLAVPVVQAGEKILFVREGNRIVVHIEIQYEGAAEDFGWLIPMPSVPDFRLSTEEVFDVLETATNPTFQYTQQVAFCGSGGFGCGGAADAESIASATPRGPRPDPVAVVQSSAGPFEFAVVRADDKQPMLDWLRNNRYVVPSGGEDLLDPYIRPGAYFLALKLKSGQTAGDLQPIAIEYDADLPMIPLILTALGATPDMGVLVWVLGDSRAVPTNYRHVRINEEYIDWVNGAANYAEVVARAVDEAENGHAFVTEYAGTSAPVVGVLDAPLRFGRRDDFERRTDPVRYVGALEDLDFPMDLLRSVLERAFPVPAEAIRNGIQPDQYYENLSNSLATFDPTASFDPVALTEEIWERIVIPAFSAGALFRRHEYLTRLYTAISPNEMTADPVFAFNPDLGDVSNQRFASMVEACDPADDDYPWQMTLDDGRQYAVRDPSDWANRSSGAPRAAVIERMGLEGEPTIEVDNRALLASMAGLPDGGGCTSTGRNRWSALFNLAFILGSVWVVRRKLRS